MEEKIKELQVGDVLYYQHYRKYSKKAKIDRVTKNYAFSGSTKFRREYNATVREVGGNSQWSSGTWYIETPAIVEEANKQITRSSITTLADKIKGALFEKLTLEQLQELESKLSEVLSQKDPK